MKEILVVNICKEELHFYEFVKPILDLLDYNKIDYIVKNCKNLSRKDLEICEKVIICGTSLFDNFFMEDIKKFKWIKNFDKPILGICGGMEIMGVVFGGKLKNKTEIGFYKENFYKNFLGFIGEKEVYHLHNYYIDFSNLNDFEIFYGNKIGQAVKHKEKNIYGVLFHPEVRNKELIVNFLRYDFSKLKEKDFESGNVDKIIDSIKNNPVKSYSLDKKLLMKGWRKWKNSIT